MTTFESRDHLVYIRGLLHGPGGAYNVRLAVDTGATISVISKLALARAGYNPLLGESRTFFNTDSLHTATVLSVRRLDAMEHSFFELAVVSVDLPSESGIDGLLGLNAFRDKRLVIDFRAGEIALD